MNRFLPYCVILAHQQQILPCHDPSFFVITFVCVCALVCMCMDACAPAYRSQKKALEPTKLKSGIVVREPTWVLGTKLQSCARIVSSLDLGVFF